MTGLRVADVGDFDGFCRLRCQTDNVALTGHTGAPSYGNLARWYEGQLRSAAHSIYVQIEDSLPVGYPYADIHTASKINVADAVYRG